MRRRGVPLLLLLLHLMLHVARISQRDEEHECRDANGNGGTPRQDPAESLDFRARIRVEGDCDFVVELLDLQKVPC